MSKSLGNVVTISDFLREHEADVLRLIVLSSYYRSPLVYGAEIVADQERKLARLRSALEPAAGDSRATARRPSSSARSIAARARALRRGDGRRLQHRRARWRRCSSWCARSTPRATPASAAQPFAAAQAALRELAGVLGLRLAAPQRAGAGGRAVHRAADRAARRAAQGQAVRAGRYGAHAPGRAGYYAGGWAAGHTLESGSESEVIRFQVVSVNPVQLTNCTH